MTLPSSIRRSLPLLAALLAITVCACLVYAARSDEGKKIVLAKISTPEHKAAFRKIHDSLQLFNDTANACDEFCNYPAREAELGEKLIAVLGRFRDFYENENDIPRTFVVNYELASRREQFYLALQGLDAAMARLNEEIPRRVADPEFEVDDLLYKRMRVALVRAAE